MKRSIEIKKPNTPVARMIREIKNSRGRCSIFHDANIPAKTTIPVRAIIATEIPSTPSVAIPNATGQNLAGLGAQLAGLKFSREDEYDADRRGLSYAHYANYDPEGMVRFFKKLQKLEKREGGGGGPEWLQNHPITNSRITKAEVLIERKDFRYGQ